MAKNASAKNLRELPKGLAQVLADREANDDSELLPNDLIELPVFSVRRNGRQADGRPEVVEGEVRKPAHGRSDR